MQVLANKLRATDHSVVIPSTLSLTVVQRQAAASASARPSRSVQHLLPNGAPTARSLTPPSKLAHAASLTVSHGQKGFTGGPFGGTCGTVGVGILGVHGTLFAVHREERRKRVSESVARVLLAMALSLDLFSLFAVMIRVLYRLVLLIEELT